MPVSDLMAEWFEDDRLRAMLAGPGVSGTMLGPRSAGSSLVLLLREACRQRAGGRSIRARGGPGAVTHALAAAARAAGAEIRTGATVERIVVSGGQVAAVVANGQEIRCGTVLSGLDPKTTFLQLVDPAELAPEFTTQVRNYRASGTVATRFSPACATSSWTGRRPRRCSTPPSRATPRTSAGWQSAS